MIKIAFHIRKNSFSERWVSYCISNSIDFIEIDVFSNEVLSILKEEKVTHFMWHVNHSSNKDLLIFQSILNSIENLKIKTFPNFNTRWHFDDKIAQKYLLESINAPMISTFIFYEEQKANIFLTKIHFPIITKLRKGAGSTNVKLLLNKNEALKHVKKMFNKGENPISLPLNNLSQKIRLVKKIKSPFKILNKIIPFIKNNIYENKIVLRENGYVFFQKYLENNLFDTRIIVIGEIAFGIRRFNRKNDFRASGSGLIDYDTRKIDINMIKIAFDISNKLNAQCLAFDFVYDNKELKIIEISFGFSMKAYDDCEGYWDHQLTFFKGKFNPQEIMLKNLIYDSSN